MQPCVDSRDGSAFDDVVNLARGYELRKQRVQREQHVAIDAPVDVDAIKATDRSDQRRYSLGIASVDAQLGAMRPGQLVVVGARIGVGKTAFAEQAVLHNGQMHTVVFATLEQTGEDVRDSLLARKMGISLEDAEREIASDSERYHDAREQLRAMKIKLWHPKPRRPRTVDAIVGHAVAAGADMLVIDYTRYIGGWKAGDAASDILQQLSQATKEHRLLTMLLAQLKTDAHGKRPEIDMLQDTTRLEQEADKVLLLYRPFGADPKRDTIAEVLCVKNRRGRVFRAHTHWYGPMRSFYSMSDEDAARAECCKARKPSAQTTVSIARDPPAAVDTAPSHYEAELDLGDPADVFG
jgi:replicative DNA helicase